MHHDIVVYMHHILLYISPLFEHGHSRSAGLSKGGGTPKQWLWNNAEHMILIRGRIMIKHWISGYQMGIPLSDNLIDPFARAGIC